jgi:hypothetical protein
MTFCIILPIIDRAPVIEDIMTLDNLLCSERFSSLESVFLYAPTDGGLYDDSLEWLNIPALMPRTSANPALKFLPWLF